MRPQSAGGGRALPAPGSSESAGYGLGYSVQSSSAVRVTVARASNCRTAGCGIRKGPRSPWLACGGVFAPPSPGNSEPPSRARRRRGGWDWARPGREGPGKTTQIALQWARPPGGADSPEPPTYLRGFLDALFPAARSYLSREVPLSRSAGHSSRTGWARSNACGPARRANTSR